MNPTAPAFLEPGALKNAPPPLADLIRKVSGLERLSRAYASALSECSDNLNFPESALRALAIRCVVTPDDLAKIPKTGPAIIAANHPFGMLEGLVFAALLPRLRPDFKILANSLLGSVDGVRDHLILVDVFTGPGAALANSRPLAEAVKWLKSGGLLVIFPAGEVSSWDWRTGMVTDPKWNHAVARLSTKTGAAVVPAFFNGANSLPFQMLGMIHPMLRTMRLPAELMKKRGSSIELRFSTPVAAKELIELPNQNQQTEYLRARTYLLGFRRPATEAASILNSAPAILPPSAPPQELEREIAALPDSHRLDQSGGYQVLLAQAQQIPALLNEIGLLREATFRQAGEGTGLHRDLDPFDAHYDHIFVWNQAKRELVGAYRLAETSRILSRYGPEGLYTSTLFHYTPAFFKRLGPSIELGRSFVRVEYQREYAPLTLLWKGIARYVAARPESPVLFGAVSVSETYHLASRTLIVEYLRRQSAGQNLRRFVKAKNPFRPPLAGTGELKRYLEFMRSLDGLSTVISDMESDGKGVPVLLRQYLKLGGQVLAFHVDRQFGNCLDCLILVDLRQAGHATLRRFMGEAGMRRFLAAHPETPSQRAS